MDRNEGDLKILLKMKSLTGRRLMIFVESVWLSMELMEEIFRLLSSARKCSPRNVDNLMPQHPRRQGRRQSRQLIEGLGMLLSDLLGVGGYDDYQPSIPDNIAMSLYGEWPWQGRQLTTHNSQLRAQQSWLTSSDILSWAVLATGLSATVWRVWIFTQVRGGRHQSVLGRHGRSLPSHHPAWRPGAGARGLGLPRRAAGGGALADQDNHTLCHASQVQFLTQVCLAFLSFLVSMKSPLITIWLCYISMKV